MVDTISLDDIHRACNILYRNPEIIQTPLLSHVQGMFPSLDPDMDLYLKLENMQTLGSFKFRGAIHQMEHLSDDICNGSRRAIVASGGNYGKAFAYCMSKRGLGGLVLMRSSVSQDRVKFIEKCGLDVKQVAVSDIQEQVDDYVANGYTCIKSSDAVNIAAYGSIALEILREVPEPDVVAVCCGSAGLASGVSAALNLSGCRKCRVYAVEPTGAPTLYESMKAGHGVTMTDVQSVATGLMAPCTGELPYQICKQYLEDVLLVSDEELLQCMKMLYDRGLTVEPAGAAAFTALVQGRVKDVKGKKVVIVITGGNITPTELAKLIG